MIENLKFDKNGLIPAVVQDYYTGEVLTLAYMNRESLQITLDEGYTCFFSRSRQCLWRKGETSGNRQQVVSITADCDFDALTVKVKKSGPACHTGQESCFFNSVFDADDESQCDKSVECQSEDNTAVSKGSALPEDGQTTVREDIDEFAISNLYDLLVERRANPKQGSYTSYLFEKGREKILKKVGEECTEVIIGAMKNSREETIYEIADLCYHVLVLMTEMGLTPDDIITELASRHVVDKKVKQETMK